MIGHWMRVGTLWIVGCGVVGVVLGVVWTHFVFVEFWNYILYA